jgi:serine/threonine-protein kinase
MSEDDKATLDGSGAVAQNGSRAVGERGVLVEGSVGGDVVTGTKVVIYQGEQLRIPNAAAVAAHRVALQAQLTQAARARWGGMAAYLHEEGAALPLEASPYETGRLGAREDLLQALHAADRLLVLGGPGAGKSVALERLAWELCQVPEPRVPVLLPLFRYEGVPLAEWVRAYLQGTGHLRLDNSRTLHAFLKEGAARCLFLFDGLNEVQPAYRDTLVGELVRWMAAYPRHPVDLTSRPQDELWRRVRDAVDRALVVQPISATQVQHYLATQLPGQGARLYAQLDERLRELARTPLLLWLIKEAGAVEESVPGNRGELYARFVSRMLRRDTDRRMDAALPERHKRQALTVLAYYLGQQQRLTCSYEEALRVVARHWSEKQARSLLAACRRHGLLAGEEALWFAPHQTVQEYFMARALHYRWRRERAQPTLQRWWWRLRVRWGRAPGLLAWTGNEWWLETFIQLAGLVDDADALVRDVSRTNPWLALWCVGEGGDVSEEIQALVEERSVHVLHASRLRGRRRAVEALVRIRSERVIEPLFWAAGDQDREISSLAVQALGGLGEVVKPRAIAALENKDFWLGVLRYTAVYPDTELLTRLSLVFQEILGFPVVWVPAGPFLMGSDRKDDSQAFSSEIPLHTVTLPGYWIGRYPVTVTQFRGFAAEQRWANRKRLRGPGEHPMVNVTWYDALSYCRWLQQQTGLPVTLPSEAEWEKAARGTEGRLYPWGDGEPTADLCNFSEHVDGTTPIGYYSPQGDSPYGCADMAGNVWEWTRSLWGKDFFNPISNYPYKPGNGRKNPETEDVVLQVLRGGAFDSDSRFVRCAYRGRLDPRIRYSYTGFRVVISSYL